MDKEQRFIQYINGELDAEAEREVLHEIAEDPELRAMLRFEHQLIQTLPQFDLNESLDITVPEGFSDRVMMQIVENEAAENVASTFSKVLDQLLVFLWQKRDLQWRPAYMVLVLVIMVGIGRSYWITSNHSSIANEQALSIPEVQQQIQTVSDYNEEVMLRFVYIDDEASSISVAGDFSNWEPIPLTEKIVNGRRVWTGLVAMSRGEHNYMFQIDGEKWVTDPMATVQREDGFGNKNAVIYL
jgi:hypothetical protein